MITKDDRAKESSIGRWYEDWHHADHAQVFDGRSALTPEGLVRDYGSFSDVQLLKERVGRSQVAVLLEIGCATGEFYRYLRLAHPRIQYYGVDLSRSAIARAREKYPEGRFFLCDPGLGLKETLGLLPLPEKLEIVYAKDVLHHQVRPLEFLSELLLLPTEMLIVRTRTRDLGPTVNDPELSCQYHYEGWMPYIVLNLDELIGLIRSQVPQAEILAYRNHTVLGGRENRFLPKDCYLPQTGTAETAVGVFFKTEHPGQVKIEDRKDRDLNYPMGYRVRNFIGRLFSTRSLR